MTNTIPIIDLSDWAVHEGNIGVLSGLADLLEDGGNATLALFLDLVPERGTPLHERYRLWQQKHNRHDAPFSEFALEEVCATHLAMLLPKFCDFRGTDLGNMVFAPLVLQEILRSRTKLTNDVIAGIHFGVQSNPLVAGVIAKRVCNGCSNTVCTLNPKYEA